MIAEVVAGVLVEAISATGRQIGAAVLGVPGRKKAEDLAIARWFDTYQLTSEPPELNGLSTVVTDRLAIRLQSNQIQCPFTGSWCDTPACAGCLRF